LLDRGICLQLKGELGSGKTCFVQGLARGLGVPETYEITSPTYSLINEYAGRLPLYHVDLYRLEEQVDFESIGLDDVLAEDAVVAVEWAERLPRKYWPRSGLIITFAFDPDDNRLIRLFGDGHQNDILIKELITN
jgi:tRNA threonylcarbamoyladenosine biosynthesis protein TsaE